MIRRSQRRDREHPNSSRQPCGHGGSSGERGGAKGKEGDAPVEPVGQDAGADPAHEAAEGGPADVEAHDESDAVGRPFFANVGDQNGDDTGTRMPCRKRQKISWPSDVEVAASSVGMEIPSSEATMTRLRDIRSVRAPKMGAESATPSVAAETVMPAAVLEA